MALRSGSKLVQAMTNNTQRIISRETSQHSAKVLTMEELAPQSVSPFIDATISRLLKL